MSKPTTRSSGKSGETSPIVEPPTKRRRRDTVVQPNRAILTGTFVSSDDSTPMLERGVYIAPDSQVKRGKFTEHLQLTRGSVLNSDESVETGEFVNNTLQKGTLINEFGRVMSGTFTNDDSDLRLIEGFTAWTNGNFEIGTFSNRGRMDHRCFREGLFLTKKEDGYVLQVGSFRDGQCLGVTLDLRPYMKRNREITESSSEIQSNDEEHNEI